MTGRFRSYFLRGLAAILPTIVTLWIFVWGYRFIQNNISIHINRGIVHLLIQAGLFEEAARDQLYNFWVHGPGAITGFIVALAAVWFVGLMLASMVGKALWRLMEKFIMRTPFLKRVYPYVKQITDFFLTQDRLAFSKVIAFQYPHQGAWALGMVTGSGLKKVTKHLGKEMVTVFLPTSPTPFTGFVMMVPKEDTIELEMTIEQALRFTISGVVFTPDKNIEFDHNLLPSADKKKILETTT